MSGASSKPEEWWSSLTPTSEAAFFHSSDPDDPRLGDVAQRWTGGQPLVAKGQPVLVGFPCDEGVHRNHGRPGAAHAPAAIREQLYRLTAWDGPTQTDLASAKLVDLGNVRVDADLEAAQERLGAVVGALLQTGAVPIILGGGHETTYGHYLGYVAAEIECTILNVDAHLDVRPYPNGGHSGSPFRQAMEHPTQPLTPGCYAVLGAQRQSVARAHEEYVLKRSGRIHWAESSRAGLLAQLFGDELARAAAGELPLLLTIDADAFLQADVPGVSAPNPCGLDGSLWPALALQASASPSVRSLDLVEVNPDFDRDNQTARWAAIGIRQFLVGLASRASLGH